MFRVALSFQRAIIYYITPLLGRQGATCIICPCVRLLSEIWLKNATISAGIASQSSRGEDILGLTFEDPTDIVMTPVGH